MADHNKPVTTDNYVDVIAHVRDVDDDQARMFDPAHTSPTNLPTNAIRWSSAVDQFQKWSGSAWSLLTSTIKMAFAAPSPCSIDANSTSAALRITQTGTGECHSAIRESNTAASGSDIRLSRARAAATAVQSGDTLSSYVGLGHDGGAYRMAGRIDVVCDASPGTGSMPGRLVFSTTPSGSSTPVERMRIGSNGNIGIGVASANAAVMYNAKPITGATIAYSELTAATIQPDVTTAGYGKFSQFGTAANGGTPYTVASIIHFTATQATLHADSTVTYQYGYLASSSLTGAANNYGFHSSIAAAANRWNFYAAGTAPNYFAGSVRTNMVLMQAVSPTNSNITATATASSLLGGIRTGTPAGAIDLQLPTGTNMDAAFTSLQNNQSFEWSCINLAAATHAITVTANTDHTVVGNMVVAAATSGRFLTRKTAINTFITYRIA